MDWKQSTNVEVGDLVYIYVSVPVRTISFKCEAILVNLSENLIDDSEFVLDDSRERVPEIGMTKFMEKI